MRDGEPATAWLRRYPPEPGLVHAGVFVGAVFLSDDNSFRSPPIYSADTPPTVKPFSTFAQPALELGVRGGYFPLSFVGSELEAMLVAAESDRDEPATILAARAQAVVQLPNWSIVPFALGGLGYWKIANSASGDDSDPAFHFGVGAKANLTHNVAVRLDVRDSITNRRGDENLPHHIEALAGAGLVFGREPPHAVLDTDRDGSIDERDECPLEPGPSRSGCPMRDRDGDGILDLEDECGLEPGVAPTGCPIRDADRDGVLDELDLCISEPGIAPTGCPDSDGDGFLDRDDQCPDVPGATPDDCRVDVDADGLAANADHCPDRAETKNGFEDDDGCPDELPTAVKNFMGVITGIEFDRDRADIRESSDFALQRAADILKEYPSLRVEIIGHTDNRGSRAHNVDLSRRRAQAVKDGLVSRGIEPERLQARGAGPDEPLTINDTAEGRQRNRRIEFRVIE